MCQLIHRKKPDRPGRDHPCLYFHVSFFCKDTLGFGNSTFTVIHPPIEMKPLHPAVKQSLAIIVSVILFAPVVRNMTTEDPMVEQSREAREKTDKFWAEMDKKDSAQTNNR